MTQYFIWIQILQFANVDHVTDFFFDQFTNNMDFKDLLYLCDFVVEFLLEWF